MKSVSNHIRSNVVGYIALFVALSGTAYAVDGPLAGQNTVGTLDIINGEVGSDDIGNNGVRSGDVRDDTAGGGGLQAVDLRPDSVGTSEVDGSLTGADIAANSLGTTEVDESTLFNDNSLTGTDIANNSLTGTDVTNLTGADVLDNQLTGADISESSLGTVPNANEVDGLGARSFEYSAGTGGTTTTVYNQGGLALKADCDSFNGNSAVELFADSSVDNSTLYAVDDPLGEPPGETRAGVFDAGDANIQLITVDASPPLEVGNGVVHFRSGAPGGTDTTSDDVVTVHYAYEAGGNCVVFGTGIGGPS